jgi:hypothetical protein
MLPDTGYGLPQAAGAASLAGAGTAHHYASNRGEAAERLVPETEARQWPVADSGWLRLDTNPEKDEPSNALGEQLTSPATGAGRTAS